MRDQDEIDTDGINEPIAAHERPGLCLSSMVKVDYSALSHVGKVRRNNEDHYLVARLGRSLEPLMTNVPADALPGKLDEFGYGMLVADGMGGAVAGEVASRMAVSLLINLVIDAAKWGRRIDEQEAKGLMERLVRYYSEIHSALVQRAESDPHLSGMGTTLTVAYSFCSDLFIAHVGDSRGYLFRDGSLHQLTRDHTLAQELADRGQIPPEAVARHRFRHILTNVLGGHSGPVDTEIQHLRLADSDRLLLCTDGLTDMLDDGTIADVLNRCDDPAEICRALIDLALEAGGKDNVTVVLARYEFPSGPAEPELGAG